MQQEPDHEHPEFFHLGRGFEERGVIIIIDELVLAALLMMGSPVEGPETPFLLPHFMQHVLVHEPFDCVSVDDPKDESDQDPEHNYPTLGSQLLSCHSFQSCLSRSALKPECFRLGTRHAN